MMNPRLSALRVLRALDQSPVRLEKQLNQELIRDPKSDSRDRALASNLVYGVLRNRLYLDYQLSDKLKKGLKSLEPMVLEILRLGAYELLFLDTPGYAAVNSAVNSAHKVKLNRAAGLINAVLRKVGSTPPKEPPPIKGHNPDKHLSIKYSHPVWMVQEMLSQGGAGFCEDWCRADQNEPKPVLRANTLKTSPEELQELLAPHCHKISPHPLSPHSLVLDGVKGSVLGLPGFKRGLWQMQDPGAGALSLLLGIKPGMRVLDLCAGAGGKTGHLAALMANQGELVAVEPSKGRMRALEQNLARLGVKNAGLLQTDGRELPDDLSAFDRILVDAPCTGLGTIRRRPDVRYRRQPRDAAQLKGLQASLLESAAKHLAPGGVMLYCTCTITRAENQAVVKKLLTDHAGLSLEWSGQAMPLGLKECINDDGFFRTYPHLQQSDAFFAARLKMAD
jgi:16S rRNA (cytosine967-C5)-methyltransferase